MTATINESAETTSAGGVGRIARVIGPVVDIEFPSDAMPQHLQRADVRRSSSAARPTSITLEVAQHIGDDMVRAISLKPTDGLVRGGQVSDTGGPITVPVGDVT